MELLVPDGYAIASGVPSVDDYLRLRQISGLRPRSHEAASTGLRNTLFGVSVTHGAEPVGMGRVIGDGGCFFQVTDIAVAPQHQGRGLGKCIMQELMKYLHAHAPKTAYVSLIANGEAHRLYSQFGFKPTAPRSQGMALTLV